MNGLIVEGQFSIQGRGTFVVWHTPEGLPVWVLLADAAGSPVCAPSLAGGRGPDVHVAFVRHLGPRVDKAMRDRSVRSWSHVVLAHEGLSFRLRWDGAHLLVDEVRAAGAPRPAVVPVLELSPESVATPSVLDHAAELPLAPRVPSAAAAAAVNGDGVDVDVDLTAAFEPDSSRDTAAPLPLMTTPAGEARARRRFDWEEGALSERESSVRWLDDDLLQECS